MPGRSERKAQPWRYVSRLQAMQQNRASLDQITEGARRALATGDVLGARSALAQAAPTNAGKQAGAGILERMGKNLRARWEANAPIREGQARTRDATRRVEKLLTPVVGSNADRARAFLRNQAETSPQARFQADPENMSDREAVDLRRKWQERKTGFRKIGDDLMTLASGEKFQDELGINTEYMDWLRKKGWAGNLASSAIDAATAPATYIPFVGAPGKLSTIAGGRLAGPVGGAAFRQSAGMGTELGLKQLGTRLASRWAGEVGANMAATAASKVTAEQVAKKTDNPWIVGGTALAAGIVGGAGGYTAGAKGPGAVKRGVDALDSAATNAVARRLGPEFASGEAGQARIIRPGDRLVHGTSKDFPDEELRPSDYGAMRKGIYADPDSANVLGDHFAMRNAIGTTGRSADETIDFIASGGDGGAQRWATGARQIPMTPKGEMELLEAGEPVTAAELRRIKKALPKELQKRFDEGLAHQKRVIVRGAYRGPLEGPEFEAHLAKSKYRLTGDDLGVVMRSLAPELGPGGDDWVNGVLHDAGFGGMHGENLSKWGTREVSIFDPNDIESYFTYNARPHFNHAQATAAAEQLFATNPKAAEMLPGVKTAKDLVELQRKVFDMALAGEVGRFWYERSAKAILKAFGGDREQADRFAQLVALYSPKAEPGPNLNNALRAWNQWHETGTVEGVHTAVQDRTAVQIMTGGDWKGRKVNSFYTNMAGYIDPEKAKDVATVDRHMGTAYGLKPYKEGSVRISDNQYAFVEENLREIGRQLGWTTDQVQAAVWVAEKARKSGGEIPTAAYDFADALEERFAQVSWETAPGQSTGVLPGYFTAPVEQRMEFHQALSKALLDDDGTDLIAKWLNLPSPGSFDAPGVYVNPKGQLELNPGAQTKVAAPKAKQSIAGVPIPEAKDTVAPEAKKLINAYSAIRGYLLRQEAVPWTRPFPAKSLTEADGRAIRIGRTLTEEEAGNLARALGPDVGIIATEDGAWLRNFSDLDNRSFHNLVNAKVAEVLPDDLDVRSGAFKADGEYVANDWEVDPNGEGYRRWAAEAGRSDVFERAREVLEPRVRSAWADFEERYGWASAPAAPAGGLAGEAGAVSTPLAAQLALIGGGGALGWATADDEEDRWKRALAFAVGGAALGAGGMAAAKYMGQPPVTPGAKPPTPGSVLTNLPDDLIERRQVTPGGRERIIPKPGTDKALEAIARKQEALHAPGRLVQSLPPVLRGGVALLNPSVAMDQVVLVAWRARQAVKAMLNTEFNTNLQPFVERVEQVMTDSPAIYKGPKPAARFEGLIGTAKDIFDRPEMYEMSDELRTAIHDLDAALWDHVSGRVRAEYGVDVHPYQAQGKPDFAYLPTLARKSSIDDKLDQAIDGMGTSKRAKRRGYKTAFDRMTEDPDFEPETDLRQLVTSLNEAMASNAGNATMKAGAGGKTLQEVIDELHPGIRKQKERARSNMAALTARAKDALKTKERILKDISLSDTEIARVERRMAPITKRLDELLAEDEFGPELSYLAGQQHELEILRAKLIRATATKEGKAAFQDVRADAIKTAIDAARKRVEEAVRAYESAGTGTYVRDTATSRWYTPEAAKTVQKLLSVPAGFGKQVLEVGDEIRATHLAGDFSPLSIQGVLGAIASPMNTWKAVREMMGQDPLQTLQRVAANEIDDVADYSFATGRRFGSQLPELGTQATVGEGRRGIGRIPGVGAAEDKIFAVVQLQQFRHWQAERELLMRMNPGMSKDLAGAEAASALSKLVPGLDPSERGVSGTRGAVERMFATSVSFAAAPAMLAADSGTGYLKLAKAAFQKLQGASDANPATAWQSLSGREQLAIRRSLQATATVMGLSAASAALSAESRNMSIQDAVAETFDTNSRYFMALQFGDGRSIPIGGPFRSAIKGVAPDRNGVFFGNLPSWVGGKVNSPVRTPLDLARNKDFYGDSIYEGNIARPENVLRALWYGSEGVMPVSVGEASQAVRKQDQSLGETATGVFSQFLGTNYSAVSPTEKLNQIAREKYGDDFYNLLPKDQDRIKKANPSLWNQAVAKGSDERQKAEAIRAEAKQNQENDNELLLKGQLSLQDWEEGRSSRQDQLVGAERQIYSDVNFKGKKTNPTLQEYYDRIDQATTNGRVNWDEVRAWRDTLSDAKNRLIDENTGLRKTQLEVLRSKLQKEYYAIPRYRGYTADEAVQIDELWQEARNIARSAGDAHMLAALNAVGTAGYSTKVVQGVKRRILGSLVEDTARSKYAKEHPEIALINRQGKLTAKDIEAIEKAMR